MVGGNLSAWGDGVEELFRAGAVPSGSGTGDGDGDRDGDWDGDWDGDGEEEGAICVLYVGGLSTGGTGTIIFSAILLRTVSSL